MSAPEIERYEPVWNRSGKLEGMVRFRSGTWVKHEDHDTLRAERDALAARVERLAAVLHGAKYPNVEQLMEMPVEDCFKVGRMVAELSKGFVARAALSTEAQGPTITPNDGMVYAGPAIPSIYLTDDDAETEEADSAPPTV
jgi:hypothetical protein